MPLNNLGGGQARLGENVDLDDPAVDAVAHRHIDEAVRPANRHGGLRTHLRERIKPGAGTATEDDSRNILRGGRVLRLRQHTRSVSGRENL